MILKLSSWETGLLPSLLGFYGLNRGPVTGKSGPWRILVEVLWRFSCFWTDKLRKGYRISYGRTTYLPPSTGLNDSPSFSGNKTVDETLGRSVLVPDGPKFGLFFKNHVQRYKFLVNPCFEKINLTDCDMCGVISRLLFD